jgi:hemerythrin-like metal-binding protein
MSNLIFQWDPNKYSVKVTAMDQEHQEIIRLMNVLYEKSQAKKSKSEILEAMKALAQYTVKHFQDEEKFFFSLPNYPGAAVHKKIHEDLLKRVNDFVTQYQNQSHSEVDPEFFNFLKVWLSAHIAGIDKKYGEAAQNKAA